VVGYLLTLLTAARSLRKGPGVEKVWNIEFMANHLMRFWNTDEDRIKNISSKITEKKSFLLN
jgi:hypothetical protein